MAQYALRRIALGFLTAVLVSIIVFVILRIAPGDVVDIILGGEDAFYSPETEELLREQLGLNRPLIVQYFEFMTDFFTLQWGESLVDSKEIWPQIRGKLPVTLQLAGMTVGMSIIFGIPIGVIMALKQDSKLDYFLRIISLGGLSIPSFWSGTIIILAGTVWFNWSPRLEYVSFFEDPWGNFIMFFWPAACNAWVSQATKARMMRSTMLEVLRQDYIRTAHAKGLRYSVVVYRHAMKNALLPVITIIGITVALTIGGSVIMETVFMLPGMGSFMVYSLTRWDYPVVQTLVLFFSSWIVITNLLIDMSYGWLDPRVRIS